MRAIYFISILLLLFSCQAQTKKTNSIQAYSIESKDSLIFESFIEFSKHCPLNKVSNTATFFLNTPYKGGTLDINTNEKLVINLRELDCLTFVENVLALYQCKKNNTLNLDTFSSTIKKIRYRGGIIQGYESRLHYSTDWLHSNSKKGFIKDITQDFGGKPFNRTINFMSKHADKYSALRSKRTVNRIKDIEDKINSREYFYIPKDKIREIEEQIENGDIILITTSIKGLDIAHLGYAINVNNRIHLLHASSQYGKVIISPTPLTDYLDDIDRFTGIMIARIN